MARKAEPPILDPGGAAARSARSAGCTDAGAAHAECVAIEHESSHSQAGERQRFYAQDDAVAWLGWETTDETLAAFRTRLLELRAAHQALTRDRWYGRCIDATLIPVWNGESPMASRCIRKIGRPDARSSRRSMRPELTASQRIASSRCCMPGMSPSRRYCLRRAPARAGVFVWIPRGRTATRAAGRFLGEPLSGSSRARWRFSRAGRRCCACPRRWARGVASAVLDRLARAAGIRSHWHDIYGKEYTVPDATKLALLADMGFAAGSNAEARESLGRLADWKSRRFLPATLAGYEGEPIRLHIAPGACRMPAALILEREDGGTEPIRLAPGGMEFGSAGGADGRRVDTVLTKLPAQPAGRYRLFAERAPELSCHLIVAPRQCFLPERPPHSPRLSGIAAQLYSLRRSGDQGVGDFTALGQLAEMAAKPAPPRLGSIRCMRCFPKTGNGPAPISRPTGASSIPSISM